MHTVREVIHNTWLFYLYFIARTEEIHVSVVLVTWPRYFVHCLQFCLHTCDRPHLRLSPYGFFPFLVEVSLHLRVKYLLTSTKVYNITHFFDLLYINRVSLGIIETSLVHLVQFTHNLFKNNSSFWRILVTSKTSNRHTYENKTHKRLVLS